MHQKPSMSRFIFLLLLPTILTACRATADLGETTWALVAYGPADAPIAAEAPAWIHFDDNGRMGGYTAVSYTHLDVYKRQVSYLPNTRHAFCPPRPNEFFRATRMAAGRGTLGT